MSLLATIRCDLRAAMDRDPAARGSLDVALTYPGVHALWAHRVTNRLWHRQQRGLARLGASIARMLTGVDIHPAATLGPGLFIDHAIGVVIGETAEVGRDVTIYQGVTLGGTDLSTGKRHPTIGDRVTIGAGAKVLGPVTVGSGSRIGANAVVVKSVPEDSVVVGVPGQPIHRSHRAGSGRTDGIDLENTVVPDVVGTALLGVIERLDELETTMGGHPVATGARPSSDGSWSGDDFSI